MANEAVIIELYGSPKGGCIRAPCVNSVGIEKGTLLVWSGADGTRANVRASATTDLHTTSTVVPFAGIAAEEKVASDGATSIGMWTKGIFDLYAGANATVINVGDLVVLSGANVISVYPLVTLMSGQYVGNVVGRALESTAASTAETISVAVGAAY